MAEERQRDAQSPWIRFETCKTKKPRLFSVPGFKGLGVNRSGFSVGSETGFGSGSVTKQANSLMNADDRSLVHRL